MPRIHLLPENLANRIAAGEVVERPASVVKELVENALDSGATRIEVTLREGGRQYLAVRDDGCGMTPEDLQLAVQRFATSKITASEDLDRILTMGFRGEALPSIGAVSRLRLTSRPADQPEGACLTVTGGQVVGPETVGCPPGTTVEVSDLFYNTPARLKFLATTATERGHCLAWVQHLALSRPDVACKVVSDGQVLFTTAGQGDLLGVLTAIYGAATARDFLPVSAERDGLRLEGYLSGPRLTRATRQHQLFFINRRFVRSRQLSHALGEAYGLLLGPGRQPLCALHLTVDPAEVDPNVHPTKIEVRFRQAPRMHQLFQHACEETLAAAGLRSLTTQGPPSPRGLTPAPGLGPPAGAVYAGPDLERRRQVERLRVNPFADSVDERDDGLEVFTGSTPLAEPAGETAQPRLPGADVPLAPPQVVGQLGARYLLATAGPDLLVIDQHRAAERVLLEQMEATAADTTRQLLAVPLTLELGAREAAAVEEYAGLLADLGFTFERFGPTAYLLQSAPAVLAEQGAETVVRELLEDLAEWQSPAGVQRRQQELRALVACHAATKKNQPLTLEERQALVDDLMQTTAPAVCPHGDPIIVTLTLDHLDRRFRR
jgi:DNA mismatch repair protein MutL